MITRHARGGMEWVDMEAPTAEELSSIMDEFNIASEVEEEIRRPTPYPIFASFPEYAYIVLHFPATSSEGGARDQEIDVIVGSHFLITARYEMVRSILSLHKVFEAEELMANTDAPPVLLIERVLRHLYVAISEELVKTEALLEHIERDIFSGKERSTVRTISEAARILLRFDTTLARGREPLTEFLGELEKPEFLGKRFAPYAARIMTERNHVAELAVSYRAIINELRKTNDSLLSASQNQIIKTLTVVTSVIFTLSLIAAIFSMDVKYLPFFQTEYAFPAILGAMTVVGLAFIIFFKTRRWL